MKLLTTEEDVVFIEGLTIDAVIGLYAWERTITQPVTVDMALYTDITGVATSKDLQQGVNYKEVCDAVTAWVKELKAELVEDLVEVLASNILAQFPIRKLTIKVGKPTAITSADLVGVQITRYK